MTQSSQQPSYSAATLIRQTLLPPTPAAEHEKLKTNMAGTGRSADNGNVTQSKQETCLLKSEARMWSSDIIQSVLRPLVPGKTVISSLRRKEHDRIIFLRYFFSTSI